MPTFSIGTTTTPVELINTFGGKKVKIKVAEAMFVNLNGYDTREAPFTGDIDADAVAVGTNVSLRKTITTSDLVTGNEVRPGELVKIYTAGAVLRGQAKVVSSTVGSMVVDLLGDYTVISGDTYSADTDTLMLADAVEYVDSSECKTITLSTQGAVPVASNLTITAINQDGTLNRGM